MPFGVGFLIFPNITQLDMTGPHEVLARMPGTEIHLVWKALEPVTAQGGMRLLPTATLDACPQLDLICVPGGPGANALLDDTVVLGAIQLSIEYDPQPPFDAGSPESAGDAAIALQRQAGAKMQAEREAAVRRAAQQLGNL